MTTIKHRLSNTLRPTLKASLKAFVAASLILSSSVTLAYGAKTEQFYEVGKKYLCVPRIAAIFHMTLVQMTPQELIFSNRSTLKKSVTKNSEWKYRGDLGRQYLEASASERKKMLEPSTGPQQPVSYARAAIACYKVTNPKIKNY